MKLLSTPCINWTMHVTPDGYGRLRRKGKNYMAHRVAYCEYHSIPLSSINEVVVRHRCDNPSCVNPEHLELGTCAENSKDMVDRGRSLVGEKHPKAKLTLKQIDEIRARYVRYCRVNGSIALAKAYGVSSITIRDIISRRHWK